MAQIAAGAVLLIHARAMAVSRERGELGNLLTRLLRERKLAARALERGVRLVF